MKKIKFLIAIVILGVLLGGVTYRFQPVEYKASAVMRLSSFVGDDNKEVNFETIAVTRERLKNVHYLDLAAKKAKYKETQEILSSRQFIIKAISSKDEPAVIEVSAYASTYRVALDLMSSLVQQLQATHNNFVEEHDITIAGNTSYIEKYMAVKSSMADNYLLNKLINLKNSSKAKSLYLIVPINVERKVYFSSLLRSIFFGIFLSALIFLIGFKLKSNY
jgi:hypothetical protein